MQLTVEYWWGNLRSPAKAPVFLVGADAYIRPRDDVGIVPYGYLRFQVERERRTKKGKISKRPRSIFSDKMILEKLLKMPKLQVGPTASRPGPMLLRQAKTAVMLVSTLCPSMPMARMEMTIMNI